MASCRDTIKKSRKGLIMCEVKITKRQLLRHDNNEMVTNWFYLVHGRIYNDEDTMYKRFRFVVWIDGEDLWFYDGENTTNTDDEENWSFVPLDEYLNYYAIPSFTDYIKDFDDCDEFYEVCNDSIRNWNEKWR